MSAQEPVAALPDVASYATAAVNPTIAVIQAIRSEDAKCKLTQLAISEALANVGALTLQHFIVSARPCLGCDKHGAPSDHAANGMIGLSSNLRFGIYFAYATADFRVKARRHTKTQAAAGLLLGAASEWAGQTLVRCR